MKTLENEEDDQSTMPDDQSVKKAKLSLPTETIEDIFSRLPVKSILQFRSLSKPWLRRISDPSFAKLQFTRATAANRTALFISAYRSPTGKQYLLSAAADGGPVTHLLTLDNAFTYFNEAAKAEHLNGLLLFTCHKGNDIHIPYAFVVNPSTRKFFKLPYPYTVRKRHILYLFGFDESTNEHKVLMFQLFAKRLEVMIFSMSSRSWRKIDAEVPVDFSLNDLYLDEKHNVCVNSVVHIMVIPSFDILAFDLKTERFFIINCPEGVKRSEHFLVEDDLFLIKINGCVGVVWHDCIMEEDQQMHIWILRDYENRVWVKEIIEFPGSSIELRYPFSVDSVNMDEIIFSSGTLKRNVMSVYVYNKKSRCFRTLQFSLGHQFKNTRILQFDQIRCYVESLVPI